MTISAFLLLFIFSTKVCGRRRRHLLWAGLNPKLLTTGLDFRLVHHQTGVWSSVKNVVLFEKPVDRGLHRVPVHCFVYEFSCNEFLLRTYYSPGSVLDTGRSSEQDGHRLCGHGAGRGKTETLRKLKISKAVTNWDKWYEEHKTARKRNFTKEYDNIFAKNWEGASVGNGGQWVVWVEQGV